MKFTRALYLALAVAFLVVTARAATPTPTSNHRVLFILQTSKAMKARLPAVGESISTLLGSGLEGQLRPGDTIGVWTYDTEVHAGEVPMLVWSADSRGRITEGLSMFASTHKAKGGARVASVMPELLRLFAASESLTVFIYSDGREPITGTPFDDAINEAFRDHAKEVAAADLAFVTVLAGRDGHMVKCTMNSSASVSLPALPPAKSISAVAAAPTAATAPTAPAPQPLPPVLKPNPPLIVDYSRSNQAKALLGGSRTRDVFSGAPMAKDAPVDLSRPAAPSNNASPTPIIAPPNPPPAPVTNEPPVAINPPPALTPVVTPAPAVVVPAKTNAPLIVVYTQQNNVLPTANAAAESQPALRWRLWLGLALVAVIALTGYAGWLWMAFTPRRRGDSSSLITRSFDKDAK